MKEVKLIGVAMLAVIVSGIVFPAANATENTNLRYSISVSDFENKSGWRGQVNLGNAFGTILTDVLQQSGRFIVLGESDMRQAAMAEQDLATSGRTAGGRMAPQTGRMTPAQLLVKGAITHVQDSTSGGSGGIGFRGIRVGGSTDKTQVNITIYVIDSQTGQVKASKNVIGEAGRRGLRLGYSGGALGGMTGDMAGFRKENVGQACEDAVAQAVDFLIEQIGSIPWEGSIMRTGERIIVNRGEREGVKVGQVFNVGKTEDLIDEDTGELLDRSLTRVGKIRITEVRERISYADAIDGAKAIAQGMTIRPAAQ